MERVGGKERLVGWLVASLVGWLGHLGWTVGWYVGWLVGWLDDCVGRVVGRFVAWLVARRLVKGLRKAEYTCHVFISMPKLS